jgi:CheY-like chemotaxis protein/anti-sigma regulatory factor (Ser/Thr protein kinase)
MALVLVVDDDDALRGILVSMLEQEGYSVLAAPDGAQAVSLAREHLPDLVLCDIMMSGLDGYGVLASMRRDPLTAIIPLIFLTGVEGASAVRKGMELGADDYLTKPVRGPELIRAVRARLVRHADARRETRRRLEDLRAHTARALPHEFLTPLTAVMGLSSLLMDDPASFDAVAVKEIAAGIFEGGRQLEGMIGKFSLHVELEAALARQTEVADPPARHSRGELIEEAARSKAAISNRTQDLESAVEDGLTISISKDHLRPLIEELVENALAYSLPGSPVVVRCRRAEGGYCAISVSDRGRGLAPEELRGLASYVPSRRHDREPGMGLGLANVRRIVQRWGGEISFESRPDEGTTVLVRLPLSEGAK